MKKVVLSIPCQDSISRRNVKFKVAATTKGSNFRGYVCRQLVEFSDIEFFFLKKGNNGFYSIFDESIPFSNLNDTKKLFLELHFSVQNIFVKGVDEEEKVIPFDLRKNAGDNIKDMGFEGNDWYTFSFNPIFDQSQYVLISHELPLLLQGWTKELLYLHKYVYMWDIREISNINSIYLQFRLNASRGLCFFDLETWGAVAGLDALIHDFSPALLNKKTFKPSIPSILHKNESVIMNAQTTYQKYSNYQKDELYNIYIGLFLNKGAQLCFYKRIKFQTNDSRWGISSNRFIFVSFNCLFVTKDIAHQFTHREYLLNIETLKEEGDTLYIHFTNGTQWRIKEDSTKVLLPIITDFKQLYLTLTESPSSPKVKNQPSYEEMLFLSQTQTDMDSLLIKKVPSAKNIPNIIRKEPGISRIVFDDGYDPNMDFNEEQYFWRNVNVISRPSIPNSIINNSTTIPNLNNAFKVLSIFLLSTQKTRVIVCIVFIIVLCTFL